MNSDQGVAAGLLLSDRIRARGDLRLRGGDGGSGPVRAGRRHEAVAALGGAAVVRGRRRDRRHHDVHGGHHGAGQDPGGRVDEGGGGRRRGCGQWRGTGSVHLHVCQLHLQRLPSHVQSTACQPMAQKYFSQHHQKLCGGLKSSSSKRIIETSGRGLHPRPSPAATLYGHEGRRCEKTPPWVNIIRVYAHLSNLLAVDDSLQVFISIFSTVTHH